MAQLFSLPYSPWSQKAVWALHHHGVQVEKMLYRPLVDEPKLRLRLRRVRGKVTVPVLFDGPDALTDSFEIARHAEARGSGDPLFADLESARRWNTISEEALEAGRARTTLAVLRDPDAQVEALAGIVPDPLRRPLRAIAVGAAKNLQRKYGPVDASALERGLDALREGLGGGDYLTGQFSYADIAMAVVFEFVQPGPHVRRGPAERRAWSDKRLAARYADLIAWRDRIWERHGYSRSRHPT